MTDEPCNLTTFIARHGTIPKAAEVLEIDPATLWRWMTRKTKPSRAMKRILCSKGVIPGYKPTSPRAAS